MGSTLTLPQAPTPSCPVISRHRQSEISQVSWTIHLARPGRDWKLPCHHTPGPQLAVLWGVCVCLPVYLGYLSELLCPQAQVSLPSSEAQRVQWLELRLIPENPGALVQGSPCAFLASISPLVC